MADNVATLEEAVKKAIHEKELANKQMIEVEKEAEYQQTRSEKLLKLLREKDVSEASAADKCVMLTETVTFLQSQVEGLEGEKQSLHQTLSTLQEQEARAQEEAAA